MRATDLLDRPIAFHRCFVTLTDSVTAALLLSQILYWSKRTKNDDGWFYKTAEEWKDETGLTRHEQETAREKLRNLGILQEVRRGAPAKLFYKLDRDKLEILIAGISESSLPESGNLKCEKVAIKKREKSQTCKETEITSETTSEKPAPVLVEVTPDGITDALEEIYPGHATNFRTIRQMYDLALRLNATAADVRKFPAWLETNHPKKADSPFAFLDLFNKSLPEKKPSQVHGNSGAVKAPADYAQFYKDAA